MKTQVEIEAALCEHLARFAQDYLGLRPRTIRAYLLPSLLVVRLQGMLTVAEQQLLLTSGTGNSRDMIKQMRVALVEAARPILAALVEEITSHHVSSLHHDLSTVTGEEVIIFTLVEATPSPQRGNNHGQAFRTHAVEPPNRRQTRVEGGTATS
jgi:uncharacterized protein YbcI